MGRPSAFDITAARQNAGGFDSPPYLHDGRLLTLEDCVEFFDVVLETRMSGEEKKDLVAFLRAI